MLTAAMGKLLMLTATMDKLLMLTATMDKLLMLTAAMDKLLMLTAAMDKLLKLTAAMDKLFSCMNPLEPNLKRNNIKSRTYNKTNYIRQRYLFIYTYGYMFRTIIQSSSGLHNKLSHWCCVHNVHTALMT